MLCALLYCPDVNEFSNRLLRVERPARSVHFDFFKSNYLKFD
jgi:hypothetical protein